MTRLDPSKNYFDGPISIPRFSEPDAEGMRTLLGYVPGYHVNATALGWAALDLSAYLVTPEPVTPTQVYAGGETYCLKFADEAEAQAVLADFYHDDEADDAAL